MRMHQRPKTEYFAMLLFIIRDICTISFREVISVTNP